MMPVLERVHLNVYSDLRAGHPIIRRSDRYWTGLSTDLVIVQVLIRSVRKITTGGVNRGLGMKAGQRAAWLLSTITCRYEQFQARPIINCHTSDQKERGNAKREKV